MTLHVTNEQVYVCLKPQNFCIALNPKQRGLCSKTMKRILKVTVATIKELHKSGKTKWTEEIKEVQRFPKLVQCTKLRFVFENTG